MDRKTIFIDIDGTLLEHPGELSDIYTANQEKLPGVTEKLDKWNFDEEYIIIVTARPESLRNVTIRQLEERGIFYHQLIMGLPHCTRYVINDAKPSKAKTAFGITVPRNEGLINVELNNE